MFSQLCIVVCSPILELYPARTSLESFLPDGTTQSCLFATIGMLIYFLFFIAVALSVLFFNDVSICFVFSFCCGLDGDKKQKRKK